MIESLKKSLFTAIGLASMTRERIEEAAKKIACEAKMSEAEGKKFVDEVIQKANDAKVGIEKTVAEKVEAVLKKMNVPTRKEICDLEVRLDRIEEALKHRGK